MEAPRGDVALARAGVSGADASSCQDGDLAARMAKTRRELKVWETEFATAHGRAPNKDDAALASGVKEMYGLYRSLKGKLDKENAVAGTEIGPGGVKQAEASAARSPRGAPLVDAARGGVGSGVSPGKNQNRFAGVSARARNPTMASRLPRLATDSSDDDDDDVVDATPVKAPTRVQPMRAAKSPSKSPAQTLLLQNNQNQPASPRRSPRKAHKGSPKASRALFPDARSLMVRSGDAFASLPRVAAKPLTTKQPKFGSNPFARLGGGGGGGGFANRADAARVRDGGATGNTAPPTFEPLLCDARSVLDNGVLKLGGDRERMTLSNFLAEEPRRRGIVNRDAAVVPPPVATKTHPVSTTVTTNKPPVSTNVNTYKPVTAKQTPVTAHGKPRSKPNVDRDEDEMLAAVEADAGDFQEEEEEENFDAAEARASASAARRMEVAAARKSARQAAEASSNAKPKKTESDDDGDYAVSESEDDFAIATTKKRKRASGVTKKQAAPRKTKTAPKATTTADTTTQADTSNGMETVETVEDPSGTQRPMTGRERAEARNAAVAAAAAAASKKPKKSSGGKAKPAEAADWRAAGDEAPDRAPIAAKKKAGSKTSKGNFVKTNLKKTWKSAGVKGGAKKSTGASNRYGGGGQSWNKGVGRRKTAPQPGDVAQSVWSGGDWADKNKAGETPAETKKRALLEAKEDAVEAARPGAAAAAAAAAAFRDTLEKPGPELTQACADCFANPTSDGLVDILKRAFGHQGFKPGQVEVITRVLSGKSTLALLPTGAGKSLTYQLPALLFPGLTLVVSPLLALMADQLRGLPPALPGAALRSDQSISHLFAVLDEMRSGKLKVLFVSPERLLNERFLHDLKFVPGGVSLAVVDEAHCVSEWSHNFRPAYHRLGQILKQRLNLAGPVLALTATATHRTEISLRASLGIPAEGAFRNDAIRGNLVLSAMRVPASAREATLNHLLMKHPMNGTGSVIVYVAFQNQAETVAAYLQTNGVNAKAYHAGQDAKDRHRTQGQFFSGSVRVVVATVAFGMGLDKSDVRCVVNYSLPRSPEAYIQQAGRAGRDGHGARCISFIDQDDFVRLRSLSHADGVDECGVRKLLELVFLSGSSSGKGKKVEGGGTTSVGGVDGDVTNTKANDDSAPPQKEKARPVGALIVSQIERDVDMRGEVIETVLSCLELWRNDEWSEVSDASSVGLLKVLPDVRATCELSFHGGGGVDALAVKCPLVKAVLEISAKPRAGVYRFSIAAAARAMGADLEEVQNQLQALSANGEGAYRLTDRAVGYEILKTPPRDVRPLAKALAAHLTNVEQCAVSKLDTVYAALELAANCETDETQSAILRVTLQAYLGAPPGGGIDDGMGYGTADDTRGEGPVDTTGTGGTSSETVSRVSAVIANEPPRGLVQDVRELLTHRSGGKAGGAGCMSARAVARILYGLNSPAYPAQEWRRKEKAGHLWEKHAKVRFSTIMQIASEELLAMRGVVPKKK